MHGSQHEDALRVGSRVACMGAERSGARKGMPRAGMPKQVVVRTVAAP
jgi:sugar/nucleoside kinase (ribokinase family)